MFDKIEQFAHELCTAIKQAKKPIKVISHYDADGITSAAIMIKVLTHFDAMFCVSIVNNLTSEKVEELKKESSKYSIMLFLDLASRYLKQLDKFNCKVFVIDHHEIDMKEAIEIQNVHILNQHLTEWKNESISASGLCYFVARHMYADEQSLKLALIGLVGDVMDKNISKLSNELLQEAKKSKEIIIKRGLTIFSATRPLHKSLEFSQEIFIPGVTGTATGVANFLKSLNIEWKTNGNYRTLLDLDENETSRLVTAIMLKRLEHGKDIDIIGNIYIVKMFNQLIDAREVSSLLNACGRLEKPDVAIAYCLGCSKAKQEADAIYASYRYELIKALEWVNSIKNNITYDGYVVINAKNKIKASLIGVIAGIIAHSGMFQAGTPIIALAYDNDKIKVSARIAGSDDSKGLNLRVLMDKLSKKVPIETGGHEKAAGGLLSIHHEQDFLQELHTLLSMEVSSIKV